MNNPVVEASSIALAKEPLIITSNYQTPTIEVYNPNQLTQSAEQLMTETNGGYYS